MSLPTNSRSVVPARYMFFRVPTQVDFLSFISVKADYLATLRGTERYRGSGGIKCPYKF